MSDDETSCYGCVPETEDGQGYWHDACWDKFIGGDRVKFLQCRICLENKPPDISPKDYARLEAWIVSGLDGKATLRIACIRHRLVIFKSDVTIPNLQKENTCDHTTNKS